MFVIFYCVPHLDLVEGVPVLAGLLHLPLGLDLLSVVSQLLADGSLGMKILVGGAHLAVLLNLTLNLEKKIITSKGIEKEEI